jgi:hypothetical protein
MMTSSEMIERLTLEKELVAQLIRHLEKELEYITSEDIEALEESMPDKYKLLQNIASAREDLKSYREEPGPKYADQIRCLQQDLVGLWKKASGLNELSKEMVMGRLSEIGRQLESFFCSVKGGYDRSGKKSKAFSQIVKTGA